jgi:hypothetical protein
LRDFVKVPPDVADCKNWTFNTGLALQSAA